MERAAVEAVEAQMFRALAVARCITLGFALVVNAVRWERFSAPGGAAAVLAVMVAWTGVAVWAYQRPARRRWPLLGVDLVVALVTLRATVLVEPARMLAEHAPTIPTYWVITPVLAWAVVWGIRGGVVAATIMSVADVTMRVDVTTSTLGNVFLLLLAASTVGYGADTLRRSARQRASAERLAAGAAERERLARVVHDGVLQVLSMVARRGDGLGGEAAELGRLAGEQEVALRSLVQTSARSGPGSDGALRDLAAALAAVATPQVSVATPGRAVLMPVHVVDELVAVVRACLRNVDVHVGPQAPAWVLLEVEHDAVTLTVRDDGPGFDAARLAAAAAAGRMGVTRSIRGRIAELGGEAVLTTAPGQGTEWEFRLPGLGP